MNDTRIQQIIECLDPAERCAELELRGLLAEAEKLFTELSDDTYGPAHMEVAQTLDQARRYADEANAVIDTFKHLLTLSRNQLRKAQKP